MKHLLIPFAAVVLLLVSTHRTWASDVSYVKTSDGRVTKIHDAYILEVDGGARVRESSTRRAAITLARGGSHFPVQFKDVAKLRKENNKFEVTFLSGETAEFDGVPYRGYGWQKFYIRGHEIVAGQSGAFSVALAEEQVRGVYTPPSSFVEFWRESPSAASEPNQRRPPTPQVQDVSSTLSTALGLPTGVTGLLLLEPFAVLDAGVVIESVFHRKVSTKNDLDGYLSKAKPGEQLLFGVWRRNGSGQWQREYRFVTIGQYETSPPRLAELESLEVEAREAAEIVRNWHDAVRQRVEGARRTATQEEWDQKRLAAETNRVRSQITEAFGSERVSRARETFREHYTRNLPIAKQIVLRTVEKSTPASREELIYSAVAAKLTGGGSVV
jgi:hypothetical protein